MSIGVLRNIGVGKKLYVTEVSGPSSYDATNGQSVVAPGTVIFAAAVLNTPGNKQVKIASISGSTIVLRYYEIVASTTDGTISASEVSDGTDLSSLTVKLIVLYA